MTQPSCDCQNQKPSKVPDHECEFVPVSVARDDFFGCDFLTVACVCAKYRQVKAELVG